MPRFPVSRFQSPPPFLQHTWSAPLCESACRCAKRYCMIIIGGGRGQWLGRHHGESGAGAYNGGLGAGSPEAESILVVGCPTEPANLAPFQKCPFELRYTQQSLTENQWLNYSARGGGSLQARGLKGRSSSPMDREQKWGSRPPTRGFRAFKALCLAFMAFK